MWFERLLIDFNAYLPVFTQVLVDVASEFPTCHLAGILGYSIHFPIYQNSKVSVMGSGQLSDVMATVSK